MTTKTKKFSARLERFVAEYLIDLNGREAAIRAACARKGAHVQAARFLALPDVQAALAARQQQVVQRADVTAERVLEELRRLAFLDPGRLYYPPDHPQAGELMSIHEIDAEVRACIASQKVARANQGADGKRNAHWLHELKVHDKLKALEMLGKHLGLFKAVVDATTDWEELAARLASARTERVDPVPRGRGGCPDVSVALRATRVSGLQRPGGMREGGACL